MLLNKRNQTKPNPISQTISKHSNHYANFEWVFRIWNNVNNKYKTYLFIYEKIYNI